MNISELAVHRKTERASTAWPAFAKKRCEPTPFPGVCSFFEIAGGRP